jgi:putative Holliday junction resolvase
LDRILAIDYGLKKIGLALSDPLKIIAKPFNTIENNSYDFILEYLFNIIDEYSIKEIVIGLPITLKNSFSDQTSIVQKFINQLKEDLSIKITIVDERLSSIEAKKSLIYQGIKTGHNKKEIDKTAAAIFLQSYLNQIEK